MARISLVNKRNILIFASKCTEICRLEVDGGHCDDEVLAWYFDDNLEQCRNFTYSGCGGNDNRFVTEEECVSQCMWITEKREYRRYLVNQIVKCELYTLGAAH